MAGRQDMILQNLVFQALVITDSVFRKMGFVIARPDDARGPPGPNGGDRITVQDRIIRIRQESP